MSQALIFRKDCWIYTKKKERENMKKIIQLCKERRSCCMSHFYRNCEGSINSIRLSVFYLIGAGILNVQQRRDVRIIKLRKGWEDRLRKKLWTSPKYRRMTCDNP